MSWTFFCKTQSQCFSSMHLLHFIEDLTLSFSGPQKMSRHLCVTFQTLKFCLLHTHDLAGLICVPWQANIPLFCKVSLSLAIWLLSLPWMVELLVCWFLTSLEGRFSSLSHPLCNYSVELRECQLLPEDSEEVSPLWSQSLGRRRLNTPSRLSRPSQQPVTVTWWRGDSVLRPCLHVAFGSFPGRWHCSAVFLQGGEILWSVLFSRRGCPWTPLLLSSVIRDRRSLLRNDLLHVTSQVDFFSSRCAPGPRDCHSLSSRPSGRCGVLKLRLK